jgi:hypothetical protein
MLLFSTGEENFDLECLGCVSYCHVNLAEKTYRSYDSHVYYCIWSHFLGVHYVTSLKTNLYIAVNRQKTAEINVINWCVQDTATLQPCVFLTGMPWLPLVNIQWSDFPHATTAKGKAHFVNQIRYFQRFRMYAFVTVVTGICAVWPRNCSLILRRDKRFSSSPELPDMLWDPPSLQSNGQQGLCHWE